MPMIDVVNRVRRHSDQSWRTGSGDNRILVPGSRRSAARQRRSGQPYHDRNRFRNRTLQAAMTLQVMKDRATSAGLDWERVSPKWAGAAEAERVRPLGPREVRFRRLRVEQYEKFTIAAADAGMILQQIADAG